ncbi:MAG: DinB family protein [Gemmatimonadota bacterium]|nr:DinB family protein [Gemmatimonadota bacterium]
MARHDREGLIAELRRAHDGDPWHGPSRTAILADVTAEDARWPPGGGAHSIWETVLHMRSWTREVTRRVHGGAPATPGDGDWPAVPDTSEAAWREALASLDAAHEELLATIRMLSSERFEEMVGSSRDAPLGTGITVGEMLRSLGEHDIYHSGQLALLKRLARAARGVPMPAP